MLLFLVLCCVEVHEATVCENFTLVSREVLEIEVDILHAVSADNLCIDFLLA